MNTDYRLCDCGCGLWISPLRYSNCRLATPACRQRVSRWRRRGEKLSRLRAAIAEKEAARERVQLQRRWDETMSALSKV